MYLEQEAIDFSSDELPLLKPTFDQTNTIIGLEAENLAKDVRKRRGTVYTPNNLQVCA